ncbi:MAG: acylneuraminate cytidylyltransferase [Pseudomonadota bacterium]
MRKMIAALACRAGGTRLYGKPLQNLEKDKCILDHMLDALSQCPEIATPVLGIAEGIENLPFIDIARRRGIPYVLGDETDVLSRLVLCGRIAGATDVYRVTTECPFTWYEPLPEAWRRHVDNDNDVTTTDGLPEGTHFEIYKLAALEASHDRGTSWHRSEGCSRYIREHRADFKVEVILPGADCARMDLRLTVDYPEDLVVCRKAYEALKDKGPKIPVADIVRFLDANPGLKDLLAPYTKPMRLWPDP